MIPFSGSSPRLSIVGGIVAGVMLIGGAVALGSANAATGPTLVASPSEPPPPPPPPPVPTPTPSGPSDFTICEAGEDPSPCLPPEPTTCPAPLPTPTTPPDLDTFADPPKPCTVKVKQVVAVSELFESATKPKVGDTLEIELNLTLPSKAKNTAQAALDMVTKKGKTPLSVTIRAKVTGVDDLGALVVYAQVDSVTVTAKGYSLTQAWATTGEKFALPVVLK